LPTAQRRRLQEQHGLSAYDAGVLVRQGRAFVGYFEESAQHSGQPKKAANWVTNEVLQSLHQLKLGIGEFPLSARSLADLIRTMDQTGLNVQRARDVYARMVDGGVSAQQAMQELGLKVVAGDEELRQIVQRAIAGNPKAVADFKKGKLKAADAIKGAVMRETKGMAQTDAVQRLLMEELANL
jgi:aspartyl-tRNA(Asn)/glutamyl-tRNA(Gln) amidotransferase subunit B